MNKLRPFVAAACAAVLVLAACGKKTPPADALAYIPADSPYAFANLEPLPQPVIDEWKKRFEPLSEAYEKMIARGLAKLAKDEKANQPEGRAARALLEELKGNASFDGLERLGFDLRGRWAFYGVGLVPVARWPLKDAEAFRAFIARVEQRYGEKLPTAKIGEQTYWRIGATDGELAGLLAVVGNQAVASLVPLEASDALIGSLLGLEAPERSLADDDALAKINAQYGFTPYGTGYLDVVKLATLLIDEKTGIEREFLTALKIEEQPTDPVCRAEMLEIAGNFPRAVFGYTRFDPEVVDQTMIVELKPALVAELKSIAAPVPGLGASNGALMDFGMSLKLDKLKEAVDAHAAAVAAKPYRCASLADLNDGFKQLGTQLANPVTYALAPVLNGFRVTLTSFEAPAEGAATPTYAGKLVIASPNPQSLVASARTFVPQLASLKLEADAAPVALPAEAAPPGTPPIHVAATASALGIAIGAGEEAKLADDLSAPSADPPPLFAFSYNGEFMVRMMELGQKAGGGASMSEEDRAEFEEMMAMMRAIYSGMFGRLEASVVATDRGLEIRQSMRLE